MSEYLNGLILGIIQGLTEFLPVSSSGHLFLAENLGVGTPDLTLNIMLHVGTLLSIFVVYGKKILSLFKNPLSNEVRFILIATVPTGILAAIIRYFIPQTTLMLPFCFMVTSFLLVLPKIVKPKPSEIRVKTTQKAIFVGLMQGVACLNGISRSGSTISALRLVGTDEETSAELSFLLAIPVIVGSGTVEIITSTQKGTFSPSFLVAMLVAFIVGTVALKIFIKIMKKDKISWFAIYTFLLGIACFFII